MAKMVGLSRNIKLQWLNKTVQLLDEDLEEAAFKKALNEYLSYEIKSETNLRKTREILMHIWFYPDAEIDAFREIGRRLIKEDTAHAMCIHWCLMLLVYPVFADITKVIGRLVEMQDTIILSRLRNKVFDEWGERTTLLHSIDKIIATMKDFNVLKSEKAGKYIIEKHSIKKEAVVNFILWTALKVNGDSYYKFSELGNFNILFPFEYTYTKEQLMSDGCFTTSIFDGELTLSLKCIAGHSSTGGICQRVDHQDIFWPEQHRIGSRKNCSGDW